MANRSYDQFGRQSAQNGMIEQIQQIKQMLNGRDPRVVVEEMLRTGQMSQQQFNSLAQQASQLYEARGGYK